MSLSVQAFLYVVLERAARAFSSMPGAKDFQAALSHHSSMSSLLWSFENIGTSIRVSHVNLVFCVLGEFDFEHRYGEVAKEVLGQFVFLCSTICVPAPGLF